MHHHHCDNQTSTGSLITALLASGILACSLVDDEPPVADTGDDPNESCIAQLEAAQVQCLPGMHTEFMVEGGGGSVILIDDPGASVGVGPDAWLVQVGAEADYIASYQLDGVSCTAYCGWCQRGESL